MPLLKAEAEKLSNNQLLSGVITEIIDRDDMFALLPFVKSDNKAFMYNRENALATADWLDPNETISEGASTFTEVVAKLRILAGDVDVDKFLSGTMGDTNNQLAVQIAQKAKGIARQFHQALATGDATANPKQFDGLAKIAASLGSTQKVSAGTNGNALTLTMLDELCDAVPHGADVLVMRRGTIRAYRALLRATYGTDAVMQQLENFGRPMLTHNGIPIIMNEFLAGNETKGTSNGNTTSIYALRMNEADGLFGLYGGESAGLVVENIGTVQNKDAVRIRLKWYCSLALKSTRSMAQLSGVTNI